MKQNRTLLTVFLFLMSLGLFAATPIEGLLERIDKGASRKIMTEEWLVAMPTSSRLRVVTASPLYEATTT